MIHPIIKDLRGAELIQITEGHEPEYPCWGYHAGFGFCYFDKAPDYLLAGSNIKFWLKLRQP